MREVCMHMDPLEYWTKSGVLGTALPELME